MTAALSRLRAAARAAAGRAGLGAASSRDGSPLDRLIPAEITRDALYRAIEAVGATPGVREVLEIGSSSGAGSTEAWVSGMLRNPERGRLHCLEVSVVRHAALAERWRDHEFVHCHNLSSVPLEAFPSEAEVERFYEEHESNLRRFPLETVKQWLAADVEYVRTQGLSRPGILELGQRYGIDAFDAVLIDGSEFTGAAELDAVYGARFVLLDDIRTFKNWRSFERLAADPGYVLVEHDPRLRNGFAVFERAGSGGR